MGKIDDTIATVFRQISMNRFEEAMHTARREEGELTTERFSELWNNEQENYMDHQLNLLQNTVTGGVTFPISCIHLGMYMPMPLVNFGSCIV